MEFTITNDHCLDLPQVLSLEWLETNGLGGYASSTLYNCHSRKYHGLLVCALSEPEGKFVLLSKIETELMVRQATFEFCVNKYPGVYYPAGHNYVEVASFGLHPSIIYRVGDIRLRRSVMMVHGSNTVLLKYDLLSAGETCWLRLRPLLAYRDFHAVVRANPAIRGELKPIANGFRVDPYPLMPPLYLDSSRASSHEVHGYWYYNVEYEVEQERGLDYQEDLYCPGSQLIELQPGESVVVRASIEPPSGSAEALWEQESNRRQAALAKWDDDPPQIAMLKAKSESLLIRNPRGEASIVAGYHWFAEWGRDAMIALPGLTLTCGRDELAMDILTTYASHERDGLVPNYLATAGTRHAYNSVDASLWFFWAAQMYLRQTGDRQGVESKLLPAMDRIVHAFAEGRVPVVRPRADGLISVGDAMTQLTWMDALVDGRPVTPRHGMAVELNALWYNALCFYLDLTGEADVHLGQVRDALRSAFTKTFWLADRGYLADVVLDDGTPDGAIRPNQIFAASLPYTALDHNAVDGVIRCVSTELVTPYGLRTLNPGHPQYVAHYGGNPAQRDSAYHQGTVWPWLVGHYIEAALRIATYPAHRAAQLRDTFEPLFEQHAREAGLFGISEIFDAEPPHLPNGAIQQAWSVAEVLRADALLRAAMDAD